MVDEKLIFKKIQEIFEDVFQYQGQLTLSTSRADIGNWDSINHLNLILDLESEFGVKFLPNEIESMQTVNDIFRKINS